MLTKPEKISLSNLNEVLSFLSRYEDTAIFLLGNLNEHGPSVTEHLNSGNFKLIKQDGKIVCVFCLIRRGNLLVQSELLDPLFETILESCSEEPFAIRGLLGDWEFAKDFWEFLKDRNVIKKETFYSKEINYSLNLNEWQKPAINNVRLLSAEDYDTWKPLRLAYMAEQNLPSDLYEKELHEQFIEKCRQSMLWGLFINSQLISTAGLNARTKQIATVGGVYTLPKWRRKGLAKDLMEQLIYDCKHKLSLEKLIIFTGEKENKPAQKLYESLGCLKVGYMALFFGEN